MAVNLQLLPNIATMKGIGKYKKLFNPRAISIASTHKIASSRGLKQTHTHTQTHTHMHICTHTIIHTHTDTHTHTGVSVNQKLL